MNGLAIDRIVEELDGAMTVLRDAMMGIPFRPSGFKSKHDNFARQVAALKVELANGRPLADSE